MDNKKNMTGKDLKEWREAHHLPQKQLACYLEYERYTLSHLEKSDRLLSKRIRGRLKELEERLEIDAKTKPYWERIQRWNNESHKLYFYEIVTIYENLAEILGTTLRPYLGCVNSRYISMFSEFLKCFIAASEINYHNDQEYEEKLNSLINDIKNNINEYYQR